VTETVVCPGCQAELVLPILPDGQTVQCPRCQHVFDPALRRPQPAPPLPPPTPRDESADDPFHFPPVPRRYEPLVGQWKASAAMIAVAVSVFCYGVQLYVNFEESRLRQMDHALILHREFAIGLRPPIDDWLEVDRNWQNLMALSRVSQYLHHATYWPAALLVLNWLFQAARNLRILKVGGLSYSPGHAALSFFIPFANLYQPYAAMQEIWRASDPNSTNDPRTWQKGPSSSLVRIWWMLFLAATLTAAFVAVTLGNEVGDASRSLQAQILCVSNGLMIAAGAALIFVIRDIRLRQRGRHAKIYDEVR